MEKERIELAKGYAVFESIAGFLSIDEVDDERDKKDLILYLDVYGEGPFLVTGFFRESSSGSWFVFMKDKEKGSMVVKASILQEIK